MEDRRGPPVCGDSCPEGGPPTSTRMDHGVHNTKQKPLPIGIIP